jgi:hypothetical protein
MPRARTNRPAGRPPVEIPLDRVELLCQLGSTQADLGRYFGVTERTIRNRRKQEHFREAMERGEALLCIALRRKQMELALKGDPTMLIWLGKQRLGQQ